jgi:hypothetical protein
LSCRHADGTIQYIEVKSSVLDSLHMFYISPRELEAAARFKSQFTIARVYGCPGNSSRPAELPAPGTAALAAGRLPEREPAREILIQADSVRQMSHLQLAHQQGRSGHTRVLFMQDPMELMKMKLLKLALQL